MLLELVFFFEILHDFRLWNESHVTVEENVKWNHVPAFRREWHVLKHVLQIAVVRPRSGS